MNRLEQIEKQTGRMYTLADAQAAAARATHAPTTLTDTDIAMLEYFHGPPVAKEAEQRRHPVSVPPSKPAPVPSVKWQHADGDDLDAMIAKNKHVPVKFGFLMEFLMPLRKFAIQTTEKNKERNVKIAALEESQRAYAIRLEVLEKRLAEAEDALASVHVG